MQFKYHETVIKIKKFKLPSLKLYYYIQKARKYNRRAFMFTNGGFRE